MAYVSLSLVLVLLLGNSSAAHALERIRIGLSVRNVVFLPFYYAQEKKIFEKHGLDAELIQIRSDLQVVGLVSGEIDFTPVIGPTVFAIANGMPLKATAVLYKAPLFSLVSPATVPNIKSLEGKQVAVSRVGSDSHRYGVMMMENSGLRKVIKFWPGAGHLSNCPGWVWSQANKRSRNSQSW